MNYVILFSEDGGERWQFDCRSEDQAEQLAKLDRRRKAFPSVVFELHCVHPHVIEAIQRAPWWSFHSGFDPHRADNPDPRT